MADKSFTCKLITPEARILDAEVTYASVPMHDGQRGVMHHTSAIVGKLGPGRLRLDFPGSGSKSWFIEGGFMQNVNDELTILAQGAVPVDELDAQEAKAELAEAEARKSGDFEEMEKISAERDKFRAKVAAASAG
ncbi:MAG: FoF1 ATP synthase subunit delta/epsilon [Phycisphaerales bacterium]|nr:F0F1 ATP synthase subunit epsilon [bacterium]